MTSLPFHFEDLTIVVMDDENDFDYEAARAAELQAICDDQFKAYMTKAEMFSATFQKLPASEGNRISTEARIARKYESTTLSYGEIEFVSFGSLLCSLTKYGVNTGDMVSFVDIGSGTGKAVICASLLGIFERCTGIEIIAELNKTSIQMLKGFYRHCQSSSDITSIEFVLGDATFMDWSKSDLVFAHASCFDEASMKRICDTASKMRSGAVIITLSNR
jgi:hypothetical protein